MNFTENLMIMQNFKECNKCKKWPWCSMIPDECEEGPITEEELEQKGVKANGTFGESMDW